MFKLKIPSALGVGVARISRLRSGQVGQSRQRRGAAVLVVDGQVGIFSAVGDDNNVVVTQDLVDAVGFGAGRLRRGCFGSIFRELGSEG